MNKNNPIWGIVRTILATGAGVLVSKGWLDQSMVEPIVGALLVLMTGAWSVHQKIS